MADTMKKILGYWQRLSAREQVVVMIALLMIVSAAIYKLPYAMQARSVNTLKGKYAATEKEFFDITAQLVDLKTRAADIKAGRGVASRHELIEPKGVVLFLEDVAGEARRLGVNLVSVHPSKEIDKENYREISMSLDLKARYRELAEYFKRLETLSKVVNVRRIRVESCPDSASVCAAQIEAVTYMAK